MSIGPITSPTTPILIGTVASPNWATQVEDNINGWIAGTGPTLKSLQIDGTGGAASVLGAGQLQTSGNAVIGGTLTSSTATSKKIWIPGLSFVGITGTWTYSTTKAYLVAGATGGAGVSLSPFFPFSGGSGTTTITQIDVYISQNAAARAVSLQQAFPISGTADVVLSSSTTPASSGIQVASMTSLSAVSDATHMLWLSVGTIISGESVVGALVTYSSGVF